MDRYLIYLLYLYQEYFHIPYREVVVEDLRDGCKYQVCDLGVECYSTLKKMGVVIIDDVCVTGRP